MNRYEKGEWVDAIVDENGNVIQTGKIIAKDDMDRIEGGIEAAILNAVPTIQTTGTAVALKIQDNRIAADDALWDGYAAKVVLHIAPTSSATLQINGRPTVALGIKAKAGDIILITYDNNQLIIRQIGGGASEAADVAITLGLSQQIGCDTNVEAALTAVNAQLSVALAPYDSCRTYPVNILVISDGVIYKSLQDDNLNHSVTDPEWWTRNNDAATYTATINTAWAGSTAPYTQIVEVAGIKVDDRQVHIRPAYSEAFESKKAEKEAWNLISDADVTEDGTITFTCFEDKPTTAIPIKLEVIR